MAEPKRIILGSGHFYVAEYDAAQTTLPTDSEIEKPENRLGFAKGGAELEYKPSFYEAKDDLGRVAKQIMTEEEALMKSGVMTLNASTLERLSSTARIDSSAPTGKRIVKIGGIGNQNGKKYVIRFHHVDKADGDIRITIVGNNQAGFTMAFEPDKETVVDVEFKALPMDDEGTLIIYEESDPTTDPEPDPEEP
ncbi:hypothetical protein LJC49_01130 [Ruminococcaceae bacterium OttesenSCG-928-I18]|nr:hypothetical protein [Ruminococcaceae bacterium OttesenSCG-928-I18]